MSNIEENEALKAEIERLKARLADESARERRAFVNHNAAKRCMGTSNHQRAILEASKLWELLKLAHDAYENTP